MEEQPINVVAFYYKWDLQMIKDLIDPTDRVRATGRTTILATAYMELAKENRGHNIQIRDHFIGKRADNYLADKLQKMINKENEELNKKANRTFYSLIPGKGFERDSIFIRYGTQIEIQVNEGKIRRIE